MISDSLIMNLSQGQGIISSEWKTRKRISIFNVLQITNQNPGSSWCSISSNVPNIVGLLNNSVLREKKPQQSSKCWSIRQGIEEQQLKNPLNVRDSITGSPLPPTKKSKEHLFIPWSLQSLCSFGGQSCKRMLKNLL